MKYYSETFEIEDLEIGEKYRILEAIKWNPDSGAVSTANKNVRDIQELKKLWNLYLTDETANSIIIALSTIMLGEKFEIETTTSAKEKDFWMDVFIRNWTNIWQLCCDALIFGNSFALKTPTKGKRFHSFKVLFPLDVEKTQKDNQILYTYEKDVYQSEEMFECSFFPRSDSIYALPLLSPSQVALSRKRSFESNIDTALTRYFPRFHIKVSKDPRTTRYPSYEERKKIAKKFESLATNQEFVSTDLVDIDVLNERGAVPDIESYMMYFLNAVFIGARIPPEILAGTSKSSTFATSKTRVNTFLSFMVPFYQRTLENQLKTQIMTDTTATINILPPSSLALPYSR